MTSASETNPSTAAGDRAARSAGEKIGRAGYRKTTHYLNPSDPQTPPPIPPHLAAAAAADLPVTTDARTRAYRNGVAAGLLARARGEGTP